MSIKRHGVSPRLSQAVVHGNTVYLAGIIAGDPSADAKGQTEQILKKIDEHLALGVRGGISRDDAGQVHRVAVDDCLAEPGADAVPLDAHRDLL